MNRRIRLLFVAMMAMLAPMASAQAPRGSITIERIADIRYPTDPAWSTSGQMVAFLWDAAGKQDLFVVTPGAEPIPLTDFPLDPHMLVSDIDRFAWVSDDEILLEKEGRIWTVSPTEGGPARISVFGSARDFALSPDRTQIVFVRSGQLWVGSLEARTERILLTLPEPLGVANPVFSRDGEWVGFTASHDRFVPLPREEMPYNGNRVREYRNLSTDRKLGMVSTFGGEPIWIAAPGPQTLVQWTADGNLLFQELSPDGKTRYIKIASSDGSIRTLWKDFDPAWWSLRGGVEPVVSPEGTSVALFSDRTGWVHLYVLPTDATSERQAKQLTTGEYGAGYAAWTPDGRQIAYAHSVDGNQMERFISIADVSTGRSEPAVTLPGVSIEPVFSPDGTQMVYSRTSVEHSLELYAAPAQRDGESVRLTNSMPPGLLTSDLVAPVPVSFPSRFDSKPVPSTLIVPKNLDRTRRHPAIVWIHGSGSDQNYLGWHPGSYRMYYSVHQYLAQQGYVILTPDYRGSSGYSRDWATGSYGDIGGSEALDVLSGADYLKTLDFVDPDRIGVWGLSYGGFMTLQAVTIDPTLFRAAINVAGVTDWVTYGFTNGNFAFRRMGTPEENPGGFHRSAPVRNIEKLERPLMIMHGTNDRNVPLRESLQLIDRLVKLGKRFELMIYPGETHFFRRDFVLRDAWHRAEDFFDTYLKIDGPHGG